MSLDRYWRIENGYTAPTDDEKEAIAAAFNIPPSEAFPEPVASSNGAAS